MGIFDQAGDYDESSFWYMLRDRESRALDQAIKARREVADVMVHPRPIANAVAPSELAALQTQITHLQGNLLALGLYARTILQLLHDKGLVSSDDFDARMRELDLLDGKLDGR